MGRAVANWWDPQTATLKPAKDSDADQLACQISFAARFDRETLEVETARYFYDDASEDDPFSEDSTVSPLPIALIKELGFFLVPASRTWDRMKSRGVANLFPRTA